MKLQLAAALLAKRPTWHTRRLILALEQCLTLRKRLTILSGKNTSIRCVLGYKIFGI